MKQKLLLFLHAKLENRTNNYYLLNLNHYNMKRVLFLMLALAVGMTANAQVRAAFNKKAKAFKTPVLTKIQEPQGKDNVVDMSFTPTDVITKAAAHNAAKSYDEWETMTTIYDLQSNSMIGNRIAVWEDGTAAVTYTWSSDASPYNTRGTGYNYYDGSSFGDQPDARVEPRKSGWPSITKIGNGEILTSHEDGIYMYKRDVKGQGEWNEIQHFKTTNYHGYAAAAGAWTWGRVATSGDNDQYVHVVMADQFTDANSHNRGIVAYTRSTDGGATFSEVDNPPLVDPEADYLLDIAADDYMIATNGDRVAILFASMNLDLFYIYSEDNGETWTKQVIWNFRGDEHAWDWGRTDVSADTGDTIWCPDNSASIAIDNAGTVHVAFGLSRWAPAPSSGWGYYSYWPYTDGIVYWNSNYTNEAGGHNIPDFGQWSGDAAHPEWAVNGANGINSTLCDERLWELAEADGFNNLNFLQPDFNGDGNIDYSELWPSSMYFSYRTQGIATLPSISIDENNNLIIAYSALDDGRQGETPQNGQPFYLRSCGVTARDASGEWFYDAINLSGTYDHSSDEVYSVTACPNGSNKEFWIAYSADEEMGLMLDFQDGDDAQNGPTDNVIWAVKLNTSDLVGTSEVVNPMTAARVYPNPATTTLNIEVNASQNSDVNMCVYNIMGQKVAEKNGTVNTGINTLDINTSELSSGVYFVTVKANGFDKTMKFVVK